MADAGRDAQPEWAHGAILLVPLTETTCAFQFDTYVGHPIISTVTWTLLNLLEPRTWLLDRCWEVKEAREVPLLVLSIPLGDNEQRWPWHRPK